MPGKFETDQDSIFNIAFSLTINQKLMKKIEKEYLTMKSKKTEDEMEIRVGDIWHCEASLMIKAPATATHDKL